MTRFYRGALLISALSAQLCAPTAARAEDLPTFKLEFRDRHVVPDRIEVYAVPDRIEVPAGKRFKIEVFNKSSSAVEFESVQLRKEKVLAPGAESFVVVAPLKAGEKYHFFDDFHQNTAQGTIVAK